MLKRPCDAPKSRHPSQGLTKIRDNQGHPDGHPSGPAHGREEGLGHSFSAPLLMDATLLQTPAGLLSGLWLQVMRSIVTKVERRSPQLLERELRLEGLTCSSAASHCDDRAPTLGLAQGTCRRGPEPNPLASTYGTSRRTLALAAPDPQDEGHARLAVEDALVHHDVLHNVHLRRHREYKRFAGLKTGPTPTGHLDEPSCPHVYNARSVRPSCAHLYPASNTIAWANKPQTMRMTDKTYERAAQPMALIADQSPSLDAWGSRQAWNGRKLRWAASP